MCGDVPEDEEGKPPTSFIGEGIPPAPSPDTLWALGSVAAVELVVPKGDLEFYEGFSKPVGNAGRTPWAAFNAFEDTRPG